ncbi:MFS transporter, partial [Streptomyces durbertensis]
YVDSAQAAEGPGAELRTGLARGNTATAVALAVGTVCGGGLPWLLGLGPDLGARLVEVTAGVVLPLSVPPLLGALIGVGYVTYVLLALPEPPRAPATLRGVLRDVPVTMVGGLRLGRGDVVVRRVLLTAAALGGALAVIELLTPGRAAELTGAAESGAVLFALLACAGFSCTAVGSHLAPRLARVAGSGERAVSVALAVMTAGLVVLGCTTWWGGPPALAAAAAGYGLVYLALGAAGPNQNELLHRRVESRGRATALSVQSLALQLSGALAGLAAGALPPGAGRWLLPAVGVVTMALLWLRRPSRDSPTGRVECEAESAVSASV